MNRAATIRSVLRRLGRQPRSVAVEAAYLVVRYLSHRLTRASFLALLEVEPMLPYQRKAGALALGIISAIELAEGTDAAGLPQPIRHEYERELTAAVLDGGETDRIDRAKVDAALRELSGIA